MQQLSIWEKESFFNRQDVIIIGSGFSGLWSALHLKLLNPDCKITILERGLIPTGASTRNGGFSCFGSPSELINDAVLMGADQMWQLVSMRYNGIKQIRSFFADEDIGYDTSGGYECFTKESDDWFESKEKLSWLNKGLKEITGEENVFTVADNKIAGMGLSNFGHMIETRLEGGLHPGKLVRALLRKVQSMDVQVLTGTEALEYTEGANQVHVLTSHGIELVTQSLLLCTNAFTPQLVPGIDIIPNRGQILVTAPVENLRLKGTYHFNRGFYYFRNLGNRLLLGGARQTAFSAENTSDMRTTDGIQNELERFIKYHILPGTAFTITDRWSGIMAMGSEKLPIVKEIGTNVCCCVRMSGMGVALAPVLGRQAALLVSRQFNS